MQNQYNNGMNQNQYNNGMNQYPYNNGMNPYPYNGGNYPDPNKDKGTKKFVLGLVIGIMSTTVIAILVFGVLQFGVRLQQIVEKTKTTDPVIGESITDEEVVEKLGMLEERITELFWQDVDSVKLQEGAYRGMLDALDDPYSVYYTAEELIALQQQTQGIYYGIGAYIAQDDEAGYVVVSGIIKNTPAQESNLMQGDHIYEVDGESMYGKDSSYVVSKIKGEEGTYVTITVIREGESDPIDIDIQRRQIESPTVEYEMYENNIAYIQITEFDVVTSKQFEEAMASARADGMEGLIIDLRSNPGGNLSTVCEIARMLLPKGLIVYTEDKYGKRDEYACDGKNEIDVPLVVLVNGYSASASEILAGAIKDYGIGKLVGTTTYGKGIVQKVINLSDGSAMKITVSTYYTPNGSNIHKIGIDPDIEEEFDDEQYKNGIDNQLEKAKRVLGEMME